MIRMILSAYIVLSLIPHAVFASDWTEFRGPGGQGHADAGNLPTTWSENENIAWKSELPGLGWSSPVVADGKIYLTTAIAEGDSASHSLRTICVAADTGDIVWNNEIFRQVDAEVEIHKKNSHASPSPVFEDGRIYVHFGPYGTACLKPDGSTVWKNDDLNYAPQHGNGGCPGIFQNILVICCDGKDARFVTGLDKSTGKQIWKTKRELNPSRGFSFSTPTFVEAGGRQQAVCPGSGGVWSYDPLTGKQLWRVAYGEGYSVVPRPVVAHGMVYVCSGFGDSQLFAIDPTGNGDVTDSHVKWKTKKGVPKSPSVIVVGNELYMVDDRGIASCLDARTGEQHWQQRMNGGFSASPTYADGHIYFQNETGETTVIVPGTEYQQVARNQIGDGKARTFASFAFVDSAILLRNETHLYRIQK